MIITSGRATKFFQEIGRIEIKNGKGDKNNRKRKSKEEKMKNLFLNGYKGNVNKRKGKIIRKTLKKWKKSIENY